MFCACGWPMQSSFCFAPAAGLCKAVFVSAPLGFEKIVFFDFRRIKKSQNSLILRVKVSKLPYFEGFSTQNYHQRIGREKSYPTIYFLSPTELRSPSYARFCTHIMMSLSCVSTIIVVRRSPVANRRYTMVIIHAYIMARGHCNQATKTHESSQDVSRARSALGVRGPCPRVGGAGGAAAPPRGLAERTSRGTSFQGTSLGGPRNQPERVPRGTRARDGPVQDTDYSGT